MKTIKKKRMIEKIYEKNEKAKKSVLINVCRFLAQMWQKRVILVRTTYIYIILLQTWLKM